ncbi:sugar phosphate isomerase/epimerase family protein [Nocardia miyunensis]|uniref:sugar phosphate isomerase/epimerase family protein n=1 Tax=Nocardia miyunensis TaxID=282684 RepID=UPI000833E721|nr:sugar phosphate isomerase/epimerase [Nocardia miyunensis]
MHDNDFEWTLWAGTVGYESPVRARVDAAVGGGFDRLSLTPIDVTSSDRSPGELGRAIRDAGVDIELEGLMTWYPGDRPAEIPLTAFSADDVLRMAEELGAVSLTVLAGPACDLPVDEVAGYFAALCDRAADIGARVQLEFMPVMAIADLPSAHRIVDTAARANGGLMFDTWHFFRGNPDFAALESLPGERIFAVQISDGGEQVQGSLVEDTFLRRLPGDGCFDLVRVIRTLDRIGALRRVGPEVISPATAAMSAPEAARVGREHTRALLDRARS